MVSGSLSPSAATAQARQIDFKSISSHRAALAERERDLLREQVSTLTGHFNVLSAQLEVRAEELRRRDEAEAELRKLLAISQHALTVAIERPMLMPAPEPDTQPVIPKRVRWWIPWQR